MVKGLTVMQLGNYAAKGLQLDECCNNGVHPGFAQNRDVIVNKRTVLLGTMHLSVCDASVGCINYCLTDSTYWDVIEVTKVSLLFTLIWIFRVTLVRRCAFALTSNNHCQ